MAEHYYYITAEELAARGVNDIPDGLVGNKNLIYSSPATLAFNSPGAQGFGVKRAGLAVPDSVMLLVAPRCCGRNTSALAAPGDLGERFFYLLLDDTDIVTGRHLVRIPEAVAELCDSLPEKPSAVMICITCVDALLGTDMERVCRRCTEKAGVPVEPCYMYALTREGRLPPMVQVRKSVYSLLQPLPKRSDAVNILGFFTALQEECELRELLKRAGVNKIRELAKCCDFNEYLEMAEANFNIVLNQEARYAAGDLEKRLGIPSIELVRLYQLDKVQKQYQLFAAAIGTQFDDGEYFRSAGAAVENFRNKYGKVAFSVGEWLNGDPFELALALLRYGFEVPEIFGTVGESNFVWIKKIAQLSPATRISSNLSPTMMLYNANEVKCDAFIGHDARYYHPGIPGVDWNGEAQPFGYSGITGLFRTLDAAFEGREVQK
ncbi:MAG: oxidoreductase [Lentisphaeria bacterium]|nr:oxidoreductase [Lentisphaeria bacterium]